MSGNIDRFVPDTHAGTDCRSAVRPLRPGDSAHGALGRIKAEGTHKERSQTRIALAQEVYHSAALGDVNRTPMIEMSDRGLQVNV